MPLQDHLFYIAGLGFLALAKAKNVLTGYSTPKPFDVSESERCIAYDIRVVEHWLSHLKTYSQTDASLIGKNVLELGPGSDLGIGIYLLSKGCFRYNACDVNNLMKSTPDSFYQQLFKELESLQDIDLSSLKEELRQARVGKPSRLNYAVRNDFDLVSAFGEATIDLVFSQAAFEHFDDINATISQLSQVCKPGAILIVEIDLQTHSRWIREKDPNNIYRYSDRVYNSFWFRGIPNRIRPVQYKEAFERSGWTDVAVAPLTTLSDYGLRRPDVCDDFADERNQMDYLTIMLCARRR